MDHLLDSDRETRQALFRRLGEILEGHLDRLREDTAPIGPTANADVLEGELDAVRDPIAVLDMVAGALERGIVHPSHPRYFGLFNAAASTLAVVGDALAAGFNPQLATRGHAPWPVLVEEKLVAAIGARFGWAADEVRGAFTTGGGEANVTALLCALQTAFPQVAERGVRALTNEPRIYVSAEGHATIARAARSAGLGSNAVRVIPADAKHRMKPAALRAAIAEDRGAGMLPFLVVATAGTTSAGAIDPLAEIAKIATRASCWLHVDAAWGGLAALVPELQSAIDGIQAADSITFDPHKVMSVPMGMGTFLTRRQGVLEQVFSDRTGYMPRDGSADPYARSLQWSRRFIGLRLLLPLAVVGWEGYAASLREQVALAAHLRERLLASGWTIVNDTPLPIVCFVDATNAEPKFLDSIAREVIAKGGGWISVPRFANGSRALRACINNHRTEERDIERFVTELDTARRVVLSAAGGCTAG